MSNTRLELSDPIVVARSEPGESRWGYYQFPALSRLPDGRILLVYADAEDASETHGFPAPALVSHDGVSWEPFTGDPQPVRPHFALSQLGSGDYLAAPSSTYFNIDEAGIDLPEPVAVSEVYGTLYTYRCADLPETVQKDFGELHSVRYNPDTERWSDDRITYDMRDRLAWRREGSALLPRPFFERSLVSFHGEELYADYRVRFALPDGSIPPKGCTWLMASSDNGRSFNRRGLVACDPSGRDLHGEPALAVTSDDRLVCVVRKTDQVQKPMAIAWSEDGGENWTPPVDLFDFGVFPYLQRLDCGVLLLSYGRPGVYLAVSRDGTGRRWDEITPIIEGDPAAVQRDSCGYTSMLPLGENRALIAFSDFQNRGEGGARHKAICVREIAVS